MGLGQMVDRVLNSTLFNKHFDFTRTCIFRAQNGMETPEIEVMFRDIEMDDNIDPHVWARSSIAVVQKKHFEPIGVEPGRQDQLIESETNITWEIVERIEEQDDVCYSFVVTRDLRLFP